MRLQKTIFMTAFLMCSLVLGCSNRQAALSQAVELREIGTVERLLEDGADPMEQAEGYDKLPLELAALAGDPKVLRLLLLHGALPDSALGGEPPLGIALKEGNSAAAATLVYAGAKFTNLRIEDMPAFHYAVYYAYADVAVAMLKSGADPNETTSFGGLLQHAVESDDLATAEALLEAGANVESRDSAGQTSIFFALQLPKTDMADLLIRHHADIHALDFEGETVLHGLVLQGLQPAVEYALERAVDPNIANKAGETPLHYAAFHNKLEIARVLLEQGAAVNARTRYGATPARIAFEERNKVMADFLAEYGGRLR